MKTGYWNWLNLNLIKSWKLIKLIPFVCWDLAKFIAGEIKKANFGLIKDALTDIFKWENIFAVSGTVFLMGLILWWFPIWGLSTNIMIPWGIAEVILFLISTYAYWRGKPDE